MTANPIDDFHFYGASATPVWFSYKFTINQTRVDWTAQIKWDSGVREATGHLDIVDSDPWTIARAAVLFEIKAHIDKTPQ